MIEPRAVILRARAFHRLYDPTNGLATLASLDPRTLPTILEQAEYYIVLAGLQLVSGNLQAASATLEAAKRAALSSSAHEVEAEYHVVKSIFHFSGGDLAAADRSAEAALHANLALDSDTIRYFEPMAQSKARALNLRGMVSAGRHFYHEQGRFIREAIFELQQQDRPDMWLLANLLMHLAFNARDFNSQRDVAIIERELRLAAWPEELDRMKSEMHSSLGRSYALAGKKEAALSELSSAVSLAPTAGWKIIAGAALAGYMLEIDDRPAATDAARRAMTLAADAEINEYTEERFALLDLALVTAATDCVEARKLFHRYKTLRQPLSPVFGSSSDKRAYAHELRTEATILLAEGNVRGAIKPFRDAFDIWNEVGIEWLAATVAFELYSLTNEVRFRTYIRRESSIRPHSPVARKFARIEPSVDSIGTA